MIKLVLQHKQIDHVKSNNVEELHYFFHKYQNHNASLLMIHNVLSYDSCYYNKNHNEYQNNTHNLQSSFDSILIVFYSIMVFSVIFDSSLIIESVLDISSFFSILAFHINDIDHDFSPFSFDAAHDDDNNLNFRIYCHFNCVLMKFTDIMCICPDLFLCSYQYIHCI